MVESNKKGALNDWLGAVGLFFFVAMELLIVYFALFAGSGAEIQENFWVFVFSTSAGIFGLILILILKLTNYLVTVARVKHLGWIGSIIHDPETSHIPDVTGLRWLKKPLPLIVISFFLFSIIGVFQIYQNTFWTALPERVPQQITETAEGILSTMPADQEIYIPVAIFGAAIWAIAWMARNKKMNYVVAMLLIYLVIPFAFAFSWMALHFFHHGSSDLALRYVFIFGIMCGYLLALLRSVIPILIAKLLGNFYQYLGGAIQSSEIILIVVVSVNVVLFLITMGIWAAYAAIGNKSEN